MTMTMQLHLEADDLGPTDEEAVERQVRKLDERLAKFPQPVARGTLRHFESQRRYTLDLRIELGPKAGELISHQFGETAEHAARLAVEDVERQLERRLSSLRGEASYGVPSRRLPKEARPHPHVTKAKS